MSRSLLVMPDDTAQPLLDAIEHAEEWLRIKMFLFSDSRMLDAVIAAHRRGVKTRVMLHPERRNGKKENAAARNLFKDAQVEVADSNPCFDLTHEDRKSVV